MALEMTYCTGFETLAAAGEMSPDLSVAGSAGIETDGARLRTGSRGIVLAGAATLTAGASVTVEKTDSPGIVVGLGLRIGALPTINRRVVNIRNSAGTTKARALVTSAGEIRLDIGTSSVATSATPLPEGVPFFLEIAYFSHATDGYFAAYVDNELVALFEGDTVGASGNVLNFQLQSPQTSGATAAARSSYSDMYVAEWDGEGANRFGPGEPLYFVPTSDVTSEGTPSSGSDNFAMVDELPNDGDTTHVEFDDTDQKDVYGVDWSALPTGFIRAVVVQSTQRLPDGGTTEVRHLLDDGTSEYAGPNLSVGGSYGTRSTVWSANPDGSVPWTTSAVQALRIGIQARD